MLSAEALLGVRISSVIAYPAIHPAVYVCFSECFLSEMKKKKKLNRLHIIVLFHYSDVINGAIASQITSLTIVYSTVNSGGDRRKHQTSASLAFVRGIQRWPVNSPHKGPVTRKMFPFEDVIKRVSTIFCWHCDLRLLSGVTANMCPAPGSSPTVGPAGISGRSANVIVTAGSDRNAPSLQHSHVHTIPPKCGKQRKIKLVILIVVVRDVSASDRVTRTKSLAYAMNNA